MSSRILLSQNDFDCLALASGEDADCQMLDSYHGFHDIERPESIDSMKSESSGKAEDAAYHPVDFFPDEVYALIRNWELGYSKQQESAQALESSSMDLFPDSQSGASYLEPMRCVSVPMPPPKRFYRTFWRSMTRKILQLEKQRAVDRAAPKTAQASRDYIMS